MSNDDEEENKDLTRIEDLSEFLHEDNDSVDSQLDTYDDGNDEDAGPLPSIDELEDSETDDSLNLEDDTEDESLEMSSSESDFSIEEPTENIDTTELSSDSELQDSSEDTDTDTDTDTDDEFGSEEDEFSNDDDEFSNEEDEFNNTNELNSEDEDLADNSEETNDPDDEEDEFSNFSDDDNSNESDSYEPSESEDDEPETGTELSFDSDDEDESDEETQDESIDTSDTEEEESLDFNNSDESSNENYSLSDSDDSESESYEEEDTFDNDEFNESDNLNDIPNTPNISDSLPSGIEVITPTSAAFQDSSSDTSSSSSKRENFEDIRDYGNAISYGTVEEGGNPPFSLILKDIKYLEDAEDIKIILSEHALLTGDNEQIIEQGLSNGILLISQISEYSAIYLAHRLRRFDLQIMFGLSDELHLSKSYQNEARGLVNKKNIFQNVRNSFSLEKAPVEIENIILATTPSLEEYHIEEYLGVISEHTVIDEHEMERMQVYAQISEEETDEGLSSIEQEINDTRERLDLTEELSRYGLKDIYQDLAQNLKTQAIKLNANAIIGINYQLTPLIQNSNTGAQVNYKVTCTGNAVWVTGQ